MSRRWEQYLYFCASVGLGLAASTGHPAGIVLAAAMPFLCFSSLERKGAFEVSFAYYAASLWPMISGVQRYLGSTASPLIAVAIWITCAFLLGAPWGLLWTPERPPCLWRVPLALAMTVIPPLGVIGFASPITGAGFLFPGCGWAGLLVTVLLPGCLLALHDSAWPRTRTVLQWFVAAGLLFASGVKLYSPHAAKTVPGWIALDTRFGDLSLPFKDYEAAQFIRREVEETTARVLIFPEFVVPRWSEVTQAFWTETLKQCRGRGTTVAIGAGIPSRPAPQHGIADTFRFEGAIEALTGGTPSFPSPSARGSSAGYREPVENTLLVLGTQQRTFLQRVPVPLGMWRPFSRYGIPLRLFATGVVGIDDQRAAVLICYEQLIAWPFLTSMLEHPSVLVGISNTFWFDGTAIPRFQHAALQSWAALFGLPMLSATNS
jgi:hypothetical protein